MINRYITNTCPKEHKATVEDTYSIEIKADKEERQFKILDTSGENLKDTALDELVCHGHGFILVFALNDPRSFESINEYVEALKKNKMDHFPITLVGNKCDLEKERKIKKHSAQDYAKSIDASYYECSALTDRNGNCKTVFQELAGRIIKRINDSLSGKGNNKKCDIF